MKMNPETLAIRTVNQYRKRDVLAYLGLRYYLSNHCAIRDQWARDVSTHLVLSRTEPNYFHVYNFKEYTKKDGYIYRDIYIPGPNEAFAEAALLEECSRHPSFSSMPCVFSYRLAKEQEFRGVYEPYFDGLRERHNAIAKLCKEIGSECFILYTDIKKFYPSISSETVFNSWKMACDNSDIPPKFRELGEKILSDYNTHGNCGILTGPMFSHLIANLVLAPIDVAMTETMNGRYFRYVDDIILVGSKKEVYDGRNKLVKLLSNDKLNLKLHDEDKDFTVCGKCWLKGENDFNNDSRKPTWMSFIGDIKKFLVAYPEQREELNNRFLDNDIRIPLLDYSVEIEDSSYLSKLISSLRKHNWLLIKTRNISIDSLLQDAINLRNYSKEKIDNILNNSKNPSGYSRKRIIPKLRFHSGRLMYLSQLEHLENYSKSLQKYPELIVYSECMSAIATRDATKLLSLGTNAVQVAAQILKITNEPIKVTFDTLGISEKQNKVKEQGIAILRLNGVHINIENDNLLDIDDLNKFALWDGYGQNLMSSDNKFIQELSCLHGLNDGIRHVKMLNTAFSSDQDLTLDIQLLLQSSSA